MAIQPPAERLWWKEPVGRAELVWIVIAFLWGLVMFGMMIWWHLNGQQNPSNESYRIDPLVFGERTEAMAEAYTVGEEGDSGALFRES